MPVYEIGGQQVRVDDGVTRGGAIDRMIQGGMLDPDEGSIEAGFAPVEPDTQDLGRLPGLLPPEAGSASSAQAISLGRKLARIGIGADFGTAGQEQIGREQPIATGFGEALPMMLAGPSMAGAAIIGGGMQAMEEGDRFANDPAGAAISTGLEAARQSAFTAGGRVVGALAGRVGNALGAITSNIGRSLRGQFDEMVAATGIRTTLGKITGNRQIQQAEASLMRNPATARPFAAIDRSNEKTMRDAALDWLGQPRSGTLEEGMTNTVVKAIERMDEGIPDSVVATIPGALSNRFSILNKVTTEAFDLPGAGRITGANLRNVISDLRAGVRSSSALVRNKSRDALNELDQVLQRTEGIDQAAWMEGSRLYGRWERMSRPGIISRADPEKINPTSLFRAVEKGNKVAARSRGRVSSGDETTDNLLNTARDFERVGSLTPDSGTPTGMSIPLIIGDVATTGGVGTLSAFAGSELSQGPVGEGLVRGLTTAAPEAGRVGAQAVRALGNQLFPADDAE